MHRFRLRRIGVTLIAAVLLTSTSSAAIAAEPAAGPNEPAPEANFHAFLDGREIALTDAIKYHCHDKFAPEIHCFPTEQASLADQQRPRPDEGQPVASLNFTDGISSAPEAVFSSTLYTIFYQDWFWGGASWAAYGNLSDLRTIGWDNEITSFRLYNGARPRWFQGVGYTGMWGCWTSDQSVMGSGWNDTFSSINAARYSC